MKGLKKGSLNLNKQPITPFPHKWKRKHDSRDLRTSIFVQTLPNSPTRTLPYTNRYRPSDPDDPSQVQRVPPVAQTRRQSTADNADMTPETPPSLNLCSDPTELTHPHTTLHEPVPTK